jgi:hypothetical protein
MQGLCLARQENIGPHTILGDSKMILNILRNHSLPIDMNLKNIFIGIYEILDNRLDNHFFHVLRHNNTLADTQENLATHGVVGSLRINDQVLQLPIP